MLTLAATGHFLGVKVWPGKSSSVLLCGSVKGPSIIRRVNKSHAHYL